MPYWYALCLMMRIKLKSQNMKKVTRTMSLLALSAFLVVGQPAMAQTTDNNSTTTTATTADNDGDHDNDTGKWGLAGLLGLLGLLGLRRKDDDRHRTTHNNSNR